MFCPKCGSKEVVDVFCKKCLQEERPLVRAVKELKAQVCVHCEKLWWKGRWHEARDPASRLGEFFAEQLTPSQGAGISRVEAEPFAISFKPGVTDAGELAFRVHGSPGADAPSYDEEYVVPYEVLNTLCNHCRKLGGQYFEGVLQVRNETPEARQFVLRYVAEQNAAVANTQRHANGTDYYLSSRAVVEKLAHALQQQFGGLVKTSAQLFGRDRQRSRNVYRVNALIELPWFSAGEVVRGGRRILRVQELGKRIRFEDVATGKTTHAEYKDHAWERVPVLETTVAAAHPELTVIHPESFQAVRPANAPAERPEPGARVHVALVGKKVLLV